MIITVNTQAFAVELRQLCKLISNKPVIPILSCVLLDASETLRLSATDLDHSMHAPCAATIQRPGRIALPAKKLLELIEQLPNADMMIVVDAGQVRLTSGTFKSRLQAANVEEFPILPAIEGTAATLPAIALRDLVNRTRYGIAEQSQRFVLDGALLSLTANVIAMCSTDGKRLSLATTARMSTGEDVSVIIPTKTLDMLRQSSSLEDVEFSQSENHLFFAYGDRYLASRKIDGKFPEYSRVIPRANDRIMTIDRSEFAAGLRRIGTVTERSMAIDLRLESDTLTIAAQSAEVGEASETVTAVYSHEPISISINWRYVLDFLEASSGQTITMAAKDGNSALLLTDGDDFLNVVMVMRS